jgi:cystathionine beta-lyase/cystathionine gamma-synthase
MQDNNILPYIKDVLENMPIDWLNLTTHRLDIYNESLAKTQFLEEFELLFKSGSVASGSLSELPTAYDYIRLGHPLSSILEWTIAGQHKVSADSVISFSSLTMPILAILRKNQFENKKTQIVYTGELPNAFDAEAIESIYAYSFELKQVTSENEISDFDGSTVFVSEQNNWSFDLTYKVDFYIKTDAQFGSVLLMNGEGKKSYIKEIQHVRRRETISMTPINCLAVLKSLVGLDSNVSTSSREEDKASVYTSIKGITGSNSKPVAASSGLSMQYAIMMGLVDYAMENHKGKDIKFIVPPNCYGGTNDQARRVAACIENVSVMDLLVDGDHDMVNSVDMVLEQIAEMDAVPYIIAEIPTNPRVEVPNLNHLRQVLSKKRLTKSGSASVDPVFILDQTFCPNTHFLRAEDMLSSVRTLSYVSGSKFPSGGKCTAGYCVANPIASNLMDKVEKHLLLCDNEATDLQYELLAAQLPSMNQRINDAYKNTREFVNFISKTLPEAKINFVSEELAAQGFTPSVFSLDLPTKGNTAEEKENYKRELNDKLIGMMISEIPNESKYCVSYGQLKGCYWTIPATSTQGTTKESDKDYIARVALSANMDLAKHKEVFEKFVAEIQ